MKILAVSRSPIFSPNSTERDAAIFSAVSEVLRARRWKVCSVSEDELSADLPAVDAVFSMARGAVALQVLSQAERAAVTVVNSPSALLRMDRAALTNLFNKEGVPQPWSTVVQLTDGEAEIPADVVFPIWVKRGDGCAQERADVVRVGQGGAENRALDFSALQDALHTFHLRNVGSVVLSAHASGDLVKFYGVEGTPFFFTCYPTEGKHFSKFGLERYNGAPGGHPFDASRLKALADRAARLTGFLVYGGDAIVSPDGSLVLIDFNDWPSFSPCCDDAARAIADRLESALGK